MEGRVPRDPYFAKYHKTRAQVELERRDRQLGKGAPAAEVEAAQAVPSIEALAEVEIQDPLAPAARFPAYSAGDKPAGLQPPIALKDARALPGFCALPDRLSGCPFVGLLFPQAKTEALAFVQDRRLVLPGYEVQLFCKEDAPKILSFVRDGPTFTLEVEGLGPALGRPFSPDDIFASRGLPPPFEHVQVTCFDHPDTERRAVRIELEVQGDVLYKAGYDGRLESVGVAPSAACRGQRAVVQLFLRKDVPEATEKLEPHTERFVSVSRTLEAAHRPRQAGLVRTEQGRPLPDMPPLVPVRPLVQATVAKAAPAPKPLTELQLEVIGATERVVDILRKKANRELAKQNEFRVLDFRSEKKRARDKKAAVDPLKERLAIAKRFLEAQKNPADYRTLFDAEAEYVRSLGYFWDDFTASGQTLKNIALQLDGTRVFDGIA